MSVVVGAALFLAAAAVALVHWHGVVAEEQQMQANKLADWEARLRRATNGIPLGGCRSLAECTRNLGRIDILREQNAQLEEALETQRFDRSHPRSEQP